MVWNMQLAESVKKYLSFEEATLKCGNGMIRRKGSVASKGLKYHDYSVYNSKFFFCLPVYAEVSVSSLAESKEKYTETDVRKQLYTTSKGGFQSGKSFNCT